MNCGHSKICPNRAGFSLLEVLLAALVFSAVIGGLATSWRFHERSLQKYRNRNAARTILTQEIERITAHSYQNLEEAVRDVTIPLVRSIDGVESAVAFRAESTVTENADQTLKDIVLTVSFTEQNELRELTVRTRMFRSQ